MKTLKEIVEVVGGYTDELEVARRLIKAVFAEIRPKEMLPHVPLDAGAESDFPDGYNTALEELDQDLAALLGEK